MKTKQIVAIISSVRSLTTQTVRVPTALIQNRQLKENCQDKYHCIIKCSHLLLTLKISAQFSPRSPHPHPQNGCYCRSWYFKFGGVSSNFVSFTSRDPMKFCGQSMTGRCWISIKCSLHNWRCIVRISINHSELFRQKVGSMRCDYLCYLLFKQAISFRSWNLLILCKALNFWNLIFIYLKNQ